MIKLSQVAFAYKNKKVLKNITINIPSGQIVGIIGENGSGKSTLLKVMAGIVQSKSGSVLLNDQCVTRRMADRIAFMPDTDLFYEYFTIEQLLTFYNKQYEDFSVDKASKILRELNIESNEQLRKLSKGQRGRVKLAATLGRNVPLYILDEPFSGLDPIIRDEVVRALIRHIDSETQAVILSTHEIHEVEPILDQVVLLKDGHLKGIANLEELREEYGYDAKQWMKTYN